jgi:hypothetical protein
LIVSATHITESNKLSLFANLGTKLKAISIYKVLGLIAVPAAVVLTGVAVTISSAAFSGVTSNGPQQWSAGTVALTNNHAAALFGTTNITPGYTETHCITVNSTATVPTQLKMYTSAVSSTGPVGAPLLSSHLTVQVMEGSGGTNTDGPTGGCTGFVPATGQSDTPSFTGTLAVFASNSSYANGVGNFALPAGGSRQYQITVALPSSTPNTLQGTTAGATFIWEAQG